MKKARPPTLAETRSAGRRPQNGDGLRAIPMPLLVLADLVGVRVRLWPDPSGTRFVEGRVKRSGSRFLLGVHELTPRSKVDVLSSVKP